MITVEGLKKIVELCKTVPEEFRQKCFELLLQHSLQATEPTNKLVPPPTDDQTHQTPPIKHKQFRLPMDVKAFLSQYGIEDSLLWKLFLIEGTEIRPIYNLKTTKKAKAQISLALLMALQNAISTGQFQVDIEELRKQCGEHKCYDSPNFMKNLKLNEKFFKEVSSDKPLILSPDGKSDLADLLEEMKS
ncbi:MAG: hypothetical protein HY787_10225 [Deltaproteobacteria bacterium]|nr:hypothetical protein [Deltaproteobacteria bacterium]